ncbi:MAG: hypothetical protein JW728_00705, partial [Candidatus Aureabacteria bacterium]|nr:hypothetical protein [Candidatus Auribacterota bacterium]
MSLITKLNYGSSLSAKQLSQHPIIPEGYKTHIKHVSYNPFFGRYDSSLKQGYNSSYRMFSQKTYDNV